MQRFPALDTADAASLSNKASSQVRQISCKAGEHHEGEREREPSHYFSLFNPLGNLKPKSFPSLPALRLMQSWIEGDDSSRHFSALREAAGGFMMVQPLESK